ncbi:MAG: hypothetical protein J0M26_25390 [Planctomycetes bacterium]|nr:hypothetical protein [Planctomycetota bacterium]
MSIISSAFPDLSSNAFDHYTADGGVEGGFQNAEVFLRQASEAKVVSDGAK